MTMKLITRKGIFSLFLQVHQRRKISFKPLYKKIEDYEKNVAVIDSVGKSTYQDLLIYSRYVANQIKSQHSFNEPQRISFLCPSDASYVSALLACWLNNSMAVPLCKDHPPSLHEYYIKDSQSSLIISTKEYGQRLQDISNKLDIPYFQIEHPLTSNIPKRSDFSSNKKLRDNSASVKDHGAIIIYTSGTTGPPKGVVLTHNNLHAHVSSVVEAWEISSSDTILHSLPLHHIHGIMYCLFCLMYAGGSVVLLPKFDALEIWKYFQNTDESRAKVNLFFAVPTMFAKLIQAFENTFQSDSESAMIKEQCLKTIRLMSCGSAALPEPVLHKWESITGHRILERYGMSEIGMALSNPLRGERIPGSVGSPLPNVKVRIAKLNNTFPSGYETIADGDYKGTHITRGYDDISGELFVKGPTVFKEYWNKPKETKDSFTKDGWFITGDTAAYENGVYRILGRTSSDIIKSGGYKISALDIERHLLSHPDISECSVLGLSDDLWGEKVTAVIITKSGNELQQDDLKAWCKNLMPSYCVPKDFIFVKELQRNMLGKVNKKELRSKLEKEIAL